jgi:hypothetical protein
MHLVKIIRYLYHSLIQVNLSPQKIY